MSALSPRRSVSREIKHRILIIRWNDLVRCSDNACTVTARSSLLQSLNAPYAVLKVNEACNGAVSTCCVCSCCVCQYYCSASMRLGVMNARGVITRNRRPMRLTRVSILSLCFYTIPMFFNCKRIQRIRLDAMKRVAEFEGDSHFL